MTTMTQSAGTVGSGWLRQFFKRILRATGILASCRRLFLRHSLVVSQAGQDFLIWAEAFNEKRNGFFLDIGAFDGVHVSNTFLLEKRYGWRGICVEANPERFADLKRNRSCTCIDVCLDATEGEVEFALREELGGIAGLNQDSRASGPAPIIRLPTRRLIDVLREHNAPAVIDYLSIDVEGAEDRILLGFDFKAYRFNTVTIERPSEQLRAVFRDNGYRLVKEIPGLDCFYVHEHFLHVYLNNMYEFYCKRHFIFRWT
ncbi:MAG TPA: FkbM family methyltransferase [Nevskiaceae bacterium]|nr:FkbM family methyltransferase [Nevskiaceae bacterium]